MNNIRTNIIAHKNNGDGDNNNGKAVPNHKNDNKNFSAQNGRPEEASQ